MQTYLVLFATTAAVALGASLVLPVSADETSGDAGLAPARCELRTSGGLQTTTSCVLEQTYERPDGASGPPFVSVTEWPIVTGRRLRVVFDFERRPTVGLQRQPGFHGAAAVEVGDASWYANVRTGPGSIGSFSLTLTSVQPVKVGGVDQFAVHGTVDAQLVPRVEGTATGVVNLHASF